MTNRIILGKYGEIVLKGLNKRVFEEILVNNIKQRLVSLKGQYLSDYSIKRAQSTLYIDLDPDADFEQTAAETAKVFGLASVCVAYKAKKDMEHIKEIAADCFRDQLSMAGSFKIAAKRSDKEFAYNSPEICNIIGGHILDKFPHLQVDVHTPDITVHVEIRDFGAYIHGDAIPAAGGMPVGSSGRVLLMLSGGIDSPVAGYLMAKRGLTLEAVHFASPPYTGPKSLEKVKNLCKALMPYTGEIKLHIVGFTEMQEAINKHCRDDLSTVITRRMMIKAANAIAAESDCDAMVTGESLAQVASQTLRAIRCTDQAAEIPVLRPVVGMDKREIVDIARRIGTYEISTLPYEDCCTVFTPKHPRTKPELKYVLQEESKFDYDGILRRGDSV
ncbi:MAG: tRNA 4-thiouridine(8) synthase ThiI [Oscillospiraceae bacterium]|nr:tRNA 4-thiouridine(8) synthase ThiI [Oscillospiraceae bacterium]